MKTLVVAVVTLALGTPLAAQWLTRQTPGIPRTADGKPNLDCRGAAHARRQARFLGTVDEVLAEVRAQCRGRSEAGRDSAVGAGGR